MVESSDPRPLLDDPGAIPDHETLLRVVQPNFQKPSGDFQSNAFQDQTLDAALRWGLADRCASVNVLSIWERESGDVQDLLRNFAPGSALAALSVADLRRLKSRGGDDMPVGVMMHPLPDAPWHAVMFGRDMKPRGKASLSATSAIASWFWRPE